MQNEQDLPILWSVQRTAAYFGVTPLTIYRWIKAGTILRPSDIQRTGKRIRIRRDAIVRLANEKKYSLQGDLPTQ